MLNITQNRSQAKWSKSELIGRLLWEIIRFPLFRLSPRPFWGWRRFILRLFGAKVGKNVHIFPSVKIAIPWNLSIGDYSAVGDSAILYALGPITISERVTISQYAHLCAGTHDYTNSSMPLLKLPIVIGSDAWVCADAFIGPGVTAGARSIVGARAVAMKDIPDDVVVGGNPARPIKQRPPLS